MNELGDKKDRWLEVEPAFDKRHSDPNKNYGIHGVTLRFLLRKPDAVMQFVVYSGWHLKHVRNEGTVTVEKYPFTYWQEPMAADIGYHAKKPLYDGQLSMDGCERLDGDPCFYDGSTLNAEPVLEAFIEKGFDGVWEALEESYADRFAPRPV